MYRLSIVLLLLVSCGIPTIPPSAAEVVKRFQHSGLDATNVRDEPLPDSAPIPRTYTSHANFTVPSAGTSSDGSTRGGQVFACETKRDCDAVYAAFDALRPLAGPYLYRSPSGTVVVQMSQAIPAAVAERYEAAVQRLP